MLGGGLMAGGGTGAILGGGAGTGVVLTGVGGGAVLVGGGGGGGEVVPSLASRAAALRRAMEAFLPEGLVRKKAL